MVGLVDPDFICISLNKSTAILSGDVCWVLLHDGSSVSDHPVVENQFLEVDVTGP